VKNAMVKPSSPSSVLARCHKPSVFCFLSLGQIRWTFEQHLVAIYKTSIAHPLCILDGIIKVLIDAT
jgi:hypothetical protein